jgi:hypothetical protein
VKRLGLSAVCFVLAVLVPVLGGCKSGNRGLILTGQLVENGTPLRASTEGLPPGTRPIQVVFHTIPAEGQLGSEAFSSQVNSDSGEFTLKGPSGKGIPPGKYRISVTVSPPGAPGSPGGGPRPGLATSPSQDRLKGAFSPQSSPLEVEITRSCKLIVDVGSKPGVTVE